METTARTQDHSPPRELVPPHVVQAAERLVILTRDDVFRERFAIRSGWDAEVTNATCFGTFFDWVWQSQLDLDATQPEALDTTQFVPTPGRRSMHPLVKSHFEGFLRPLWGYAVKAAAGQWPTDPDEEHLLALLLVVDGWFEGYHITAEELLRGLPADDLPTRARERAMKLRRVA